MAFALIKQPQTIVHIEKNPILKTHFGFGSGSAKGIS